LSKFQGLTPAGGQVEGKTCQTCGRIRQQDMKPEPAIGCRQRVDAADAGAKCGIRQRSTSATHSDKDAGMP